MDGCTSIDLDPEHPHTVILTFQERRHAEEVSTSLERRDDDANTMQFLDSSLNIPDMGGPLDLAWVPNTVLPDTAVQPTTAHDDGDSSDTIEEHTIKQEEEDHAATGNDVDMDVADDVDHWL